MSLYGAPRPKTKSSAIPISQSSIHALATELAAARARPRKPRQKPSATTPSNRGVLARAAKDQQTRNEIGEAEDGQLVRSRKALERKARIYDDMRRGRTGGVGGDGGDGGGGGGEEELVDFDKKWVEDGLSDYVSSSEEEDEEGGEGEGGEMVEYTDEFGRTRTGTKSQLRKYQLKHTAPDPTPVTSVPENLIYGATIQSHAFLTREFSTVPTPDALKAAMPEEAEGVQDTHYDADREVRAKGVGFYKFSKDEAGRKGEMEELERERRRTEDARERVGERKRVRMEELKRRKEEVKRKRRGKAGGAWLEGFMGELRGKTAD